MKLRLPKLSLASLGKAQLDLKGWKRTAAYSAFFLAAFLFALHRTFPIEAVKERLILEAAAQGWQLRMNELSHHGMAGIRAREVTLQTRDGTRIPVEDLTASLRLLPLLAGRRSVAFEARLFEGTVAGVSEQGATTQHVQLEARGLDLSRAGAIRKATGLDLAGTLAADVDVTLDTREPAKSAGRVEVSIRNAAIQGGEVPVPGMGGALTVPRMSLGTVTARGAVRNGRAEFDKLEARGDDVELSAEQVFVQLQPRFDFSPLSGRAKLKFQAAFWQKSGMAGLKPVLDASLASARGADGAYGFQVYGTVGKPQLRPMAQ
jgi:type II secretion system protein N